MSFTCHDNNETSTSKFWLFSNKKIEKKTAIFLSIYYVIYYVNQQKI